MLSARNEKRDDTHVSLTQRGKAVRKRPVRYPPVPVSNVLASYYRHARNEYHLLLSSSDHPIIAVSHCDRLDASNIASRECFCDGKCNIFLSSKDFRHISRLDFRRPEIEDGGQGNDTTVQQPIHKTTRPKTGQFQVEDELCRKKVGYERETGRTSVSRTS